MTRAELEQMADLDKTIKRMEEKEEELFARVTSITAILSDMPKAHSDRDRMAEYVAQAEELRAEFAGVIADYTRLYIRYMRATQVLKHRESEVLRLKYEKRLNWQKIAQRMNYSESRAQAIHREALEKIAGF